MLDLDVTFSNPRRGSLHENWPIGGSNRGRCEFLVESTNRGYRVSKRTTNKHGVWCKPKKTTYSGLCCIVTGSDDKTYILRLVDDYGFIDILDHRFMQACSPVFQKNEPAQFEELAKLILEAK